MPENPIYDFMKANRLTDKDEATFLMEYSDSAKAKELFSFFQANKLTDKDFNTFYGTYLKKKVSIADVGMAAKGGGEVGVSKAPSKEIVQETPEQKLSKLGINVTFQPKQKTQYIGTEPVTDYLNKLATEPDYIDLSNSYDVGRLSGMIDAKSKTDRPVKASLFVSDEMIKKAYPQYAKISGEKDKTVSELKSAVSDVAAQNAFNKIASKKDLSQVTRDDLIEAGLEYTKQVAPSQWNRNVEILEGGKDLGDENKYNLEKAGATVLLNKAQGVVQDESSLQRIAQLDQETDAAHPKFAVAKAWDIISAYNHKKDNKANGGWWRTRPSLLLVENWLEEPELKEMFVGNEVGYNILKKQLQELPNEKKVFDAEDVSISGGLNRFTQSIAGGIENIGNIFDSDAKRQQSNLNPTLGRGTITGNYQIPGESNPLLQRIQQLKDKEKQEKLTTEEWKELDALNKSTKVRSGWDKFKDGTFDVLGQVVLQAALTKGVGVGGKIITSAKAPMLLKTGISTALISYDQSRKSAVYHFPNDDAKQNIYTGAMTAANILSERIFKDEKVFNAFKKGLDAELTTTLKNLSAENISRQQVKNIIVNNAVKYGFRVGVDANKNAFEEMVVQAADEGLKTTMSAEDYDETKALKNIADVYVTTLYSMGAVSALSAIKSNTRADEFNSVALYRGALDPQKTQQDIERLYETGEITEQEKDEKLNILAKASSIIEAEPSKITSKSVKDRAQYLVTTLNAELKKEQLEKAVDKNEAAELSKEINDSENKAAEIYNALTLEQKILQQAIDNNEVDGMFLDMAKAAVTDPQQAKQLLDEAKSQVTGQVAGEFGSARSGVEKAWGKTIADFVAPSTGLGRGDVEVHKQNIHDKFRKEFEAKGVSKEQVDGAIALMEARAKSWASEEKGRNADDWYSKIADVKSGEFVDGSGRQFQVEAYHGSPHDFDKFSISKIGTGEGAAAFGHGLYFTDLKGIAEEYARRLSNDTPIIDGKKIDDWFRDNDLKAPYSSNYWMPELLSESKSKDEALSKIDLRIKSQEGKIDGYNDILDDGESTQNERAGARRALEILEKDLQVSYDLYNAVFRSKNFEPPSKGRNLYKVSLHEGKQPNEYNWLDWDKDLPKEKIDKIRKVLLEYDLPDGYSWATDSNKNKNHVVHQVKDAKGNIVGEGIDKEEASKDAGVGKRFYPYFGEERRLAEFDKVFKRNSDGKYTTGAGFYHRLSELLGSDKAASDLLLKAGIDGVKYPAESIARGATSDNARGFNYVVFDDKAVTIKEKVQFQNNKGAVETLSDGRKVIHALDAPDFSTMVHEVAHVFEGDLTEAESKIVKDFGGSEPFARGFEKYLRDGKAPTTELKTLFEKFKQWLTDIYKTLKGSPIEKRITPEIKQIFDRLLTEQKDQSLSSNTPSKEQPKAETPTQETTPVSEPTTPVSISGIKKSNRGVVKKARGIEDLTEPRDIVMQYFAGGNKINSSAIKELFGGKDERLHFSKGTSGEQKAKISLVKGDAPTIKNLAHKLWEASGGLEEGYQYTDRDFRDAIESVLQDHNSPTSMSIELVDKYINKAVKQELTDQEAKDISDGLIRDITKYVEELPENQQNELIQILSKYQNKFGFIDWEAVEKDSNGFDPDILSLTIETQEALDGIIQKNLKSGQSEFSDTSRQSSRQEKGEEKVIPQKKPEEPTTPPTTQAKELADKVSGEILSNETKPQSKLSAEPKINFEAEKLKLTEERDKRIREVGKPEIKMEFLSAKELVDSNDPIGNKSKQNDIKERYKNLKLLLDCLWEKK